MTEFCLWDDQDDSPVTIAHADADAAVFRRKRRDARMTERRGGLKAIAERVSLAVFGMPLTDLDREARKTMPNRAKLEAAYEAIRTVAGYDPDHAALANRIGFARSDTVLGHALASSSPSAALATPGMALMVWRLAMRYRRQAPPRLNFVTGFTDQDDLFD
jgi:hypothetical protein